MEEVEQLIRKHKTFQKVLTAQNEKVRGLKLGMVRKGREQSLGTLESSEGGHGVLGVCPQAMLKYGDSLWAQGCLVGAD